MSTFRDCNCCSTDEQWASEHLNWNVTDPNADWLLEARECRRLWAANGEPLPDDLDDETLAELIHKIHISNRA